MNSGNDSTFSLLVTQFEGLPCWAAIAGKGTGSHVSLSFGVKIERARPVENPHLSDAARFFESEYSLLIENCSWRVEIGDAIACSSQDDNHAGGPMLAGLAEVLDRSVERMVVQRPGYDLRIFLSGDCRIRLFCNSGRAEAGDNYTLFTPGFNATIGPAGALTIMSSTRH